LASLEAEGGGTQVTIKLTHFYTTMSIYLN
jgi:hypothetical protein